MRRALMHRNQIGSIFPYPENGELYGFQIMLATQPLPPTRSASKLKAVASATPNIHGPWQLQHQRLIQESLDLRTGLTN
jgi:hypothetical protein